MKYAVALSIIGALSAQTLPRPAAAFDFTLASGAAARVADYKGRVVALYLFTPN